MNATILNAPKIFLLVLVFALNTGYVVTKQKINWISFDELSKVYAANPKPILIDVYTSWCGWCKVMDKETYDNEKVARYINEKYYAVKFDAESTSPVLFNSKSYNYDATNRANELAVYLLSGRMAFPSTVFLSSPNAQPAPIPGFLKPTDIEAPLKFFGDGAYKTQTFVEFTNVLKKDW
jgi:uncharacterized protein YyaL (SSP411 family)